MIQIRSKTRLFETLFQNIFHLRKHTGFTLIELLIVVAIIAILAAIAIPNFLAAQTRSKVSRTQSEMRTVGLALESYYVDSNCYPREGPAGTCNIAPDGLPELTTPIAYITTFPKDIFHDDEGMLQPIHYGMCHSGVTYWYLWSFGPDRANQYAELIYDPTNGTISNGDIKRTTAQDILTTTPQ
jgi:prepilin-type N-terminal cleavage/methylation domain-containing protein